MTWTKLGVEFWDQLANDGMSADAKVTHAELIGFVYKLELMDLIIPQPMLRRATSTDNLSDALAELAINGYGEHLGQDGWRIIHHADVIRQSIAAQVRHRERNRKDQQAHREKLREAVGISAYVSPHADRQTNMHLRGELAGTSGLAELNGHGGIND